MTPSEIQPGMKFGKWTVIKFDHINKHRIKYFLCECECGTKRPVRGTSLVSGYSTACSRQCNNDLSGLTFGNWEVLKRDKSKPRNFICKCKCGEIKSVFSGSLIAGTSKSCGCLSRQHSKEKNLKNAESHIGEEWGKLIICDCYLKNNNYWYKCICECGKEVNVIGKNLFNGNTTSCGCMSSKANEKLDEILTKLKIPFKREYKFKDCKDKRPLPFDFALFNNENELIGLIENNGSLHYSSSGTGWDTPERLLYQQKHDYIKRLFCEQNKIPFLIIPYQYFNEIEKFLMTSDFWQIIIKNFNDYVPLYEDSEEQV